MMRSPLACLFLFAAIAAAAKLSAATAADPQGEPVQPDQSGLTASQSQSDLLLQTIREDESYAAEIRARLAGGAADLPRIEADLNRATARADAQRTSVDPVSIRYTAAQRKLDAAKAQVRAELESGASFRGATAAADAAASGRQANEEESLHSLAPNSEYRKVGAEIDKARARVDYFRQAGPAFAKELAVSSQMYEEANGRQKVLKEQLLASDPEVRKARERSAAADAAVAALRADNERHVVAALDVIAAADAVRVEQGPYDTAMALVHAAESRVTAIQLAYRQTTEGMAADRVTLSEIEDELTGVRAALTLLNVNIDGRGLELAAPVISADQSYSSPSISPDGQQQPNAYQAGAFPPLIGSGYLRTFPGRSFGIPRQGQVNGPRSAGPRQHSSRSQNSMPQQTPQPTGNEGLQPQPQGRFSGRARR